MRKIVIITGQTATGKTKLALEYAKRLKGEVINCDSRQIYKKLDIVTGKDQPKGIKIRLYDLADPKEYFSSYDYVQRAIPVIKKLLQQKKTPIIVGGSYFYLYHLLYEVETESIPPNWKLRKQLETKTVAELQSILKNLRTRLIDISINRSDFYNPRRLIRKIEISSSGRDVINHVSTNHKIGLADKLSLAPLDIQFIGLKFDNKEMLRKKIIQRVEKRLKKGAINEVKKLLELGYTASDPGLKAIGYQQIIKYLNGKSSQEEAIGEWILKEIQYAKRQYTFMKKDKNIKWLDV